MKLVRNSLQLTCTSWQQAPQDLQDKYEEGIFGYFNIQSTVEYDIQYTQNEIHMHFLATTVRRHIGRMVSALDS